MASDDTRNPFPGSATGEAAIEKIWPPEPLKLWPYNQLPKVDFPTPAPRAAAPIATPAPAPMPAPAPQAPAPPSPGRDVLPPATVPYHPRAAEQPVTGEQIRAARKGLGWTQAELAKRVGLSRPFIALVEQGRRILAPQDLDKVRQALGI